MDKTYNMAHSVLSFYSSTTTRLTTLFESNTGSNCFGSDETKTTLNFFSPYQKGEGKNIPIPFLNFYTQLYLRNLCLMIPSNLWICQQQLHGQLVFNVKSPVQIYLISLNHGHAYPLIEFYNILFYSFCDTVKLTKGYIGRIYSHFMTNLGFQWTWAS